MPDNTRLYPKLGFSLFLMALLLAGFSASTQAEPDGSITPRIIGGTNANPGDHPWAVALLRARIPDSFNAQFCGGTLIASRWVLTAAHCVKDLSSASEVEVAIGINNLNNISTTDRQTVGNIFLHPAYNSTSLNNDIALLELVTASDNTVLNIADNNATNNIATNELMTIIGWGSVTAAEPFAFPVLLQEVQIPRFDFAACNRIYSNSLTSNMICAGFPTGGKDTCQGDSGGPILYFNTSNDTYYQTGVTSFGAGCAVANKPGVYTRTANYIDWINATTSVIALANQHQFGYHGINRSTSATLTLYNYSDAAITVSAVNLDNPTNFTLLSQNCTDTIIANDESCSITLQFEASNAGTQLATLSVDFGTGNPTLNTAISGIGLPSINATDLDETPARPWYSESAASWFSASMSNSTGGTAMRSGNISDSQNTVLLAYFTGPDTLDFRWKASTEQGSDLLKLYINGVLSDSISGNQDWQQRNIPLSAGEHQVAWIYEKNRTVSQFQDTVWLDSINTPFVNNPGDDAEGGAGKFSGFFLLLLAVMFALRKNLYRRQAISSNNKPYMADT
ncbi:MAG: trypsin-like serine protease [Gammaproteobacteria bacterium]|nr:trypsin-like serine protease [Gammaproteobacteria bacterium]